MLLFFPEARKQARTKEDKQQIKDLEKIKDSFYGIQVIQDDRDQFHKMIESLQTLKTCYQDLLAIDEKWAHFVDDLFFSLIKSKSILLEQDQIHYMQVPMYLFFVEKFAKTEKFQTLCLSYQENYFDTLLILEEFIKKILNMYQNDGNFKNYMQESKAGQGKVQAAEDALANAMSKANLTPAQKAQAKAGKNPLPAPGKSSSQEEKDEYERLAITIKQAKDLLDEYLKNANNINKKVPSSNSANNQSISKIEFKVRKLSKTINMFGDMIGIEGIGSKIWEKLALWKKIQGSEKFLKLLDYLGSMLGKVYSSENKKIRKGPIDISDVIQTNKIEKTFNSRKAMLHHPVFKQKIMLDLVKGTLPEFERVEYYPEEEKGPVVFAIDNSGSMSGSPELYSKAVALGCGMKALRQKRDFAVIHFECERNIEDVPVWYFPASQQKVDIDRLFECMEYFKGGGTNFNIALEKTRSLIDPKVEANPPLPNGVSKELFAKADVFFCSDGDCVASDEQVKIVKEWTKRTKTKIWSFWVDIDNWGGSGTYEALAEFSDEIIQMSRADIVHTSINADVIAEKAMDKLDQR